MHRILIRLLPLLAVLLLAACASGGTAQKQQDPMAGIKLSALATDVFTLSDERDMSYAVVKLEKEGHDPQLLAKATMTLSVNDLLAALRQQAEHVAVQTSPAGWLVEAQNLALDGNAYGIASIVISRERINIKGHVVSMAKLQRLQLNGQDASVAWGWALYRDALRHAVQQ